MRFKSFLLSCGAACTLLAAAGASAQPCVGFTDVLSTDTFCPNVEWIKNRQITLGCTSTTLYCPGQNVTRLQMAAFLNRLGTALTPVPLTPGDAVAVPVNLSLNPVLCSTADFAVAGFPRRAYVYAVTNLSAPTPAGVDVMAQVVFSTDGGASWAPINNTDQYMTLYAGATPPNHATLSPFGWLDVSVGQTVRFGLQVGRFDAGSSNVTASCSVRGTMGNRNGTAPQPL